MSAVFQTNRLVEFSDTDMAGIVHFARFFIFMESAEHAYLRACGLSVAMEREGQKISFPRVSCTCDFIKPARFQDVLDISVRVEKVGRSSVSYAFEFYKAGDLIARGALTAVLCKFGGPRGMEAIEIPPDIRSKIEQGPQ